MKVLICILPFALSSDFSDNQAAVTSPDNLNNVSHQTITLNANHLNTKHPLTIAQTIIHEALHAFLNYKQSDGICNPNNDGPSIYELESLTLGELLNDFNYNCIENATNDHNLMFNLLVPIMQNMLEEIYTDLVDSEDINYDYNFWWDFSQTEPETWHWLNETDSNGNISEGCLFYMSLVGLGQASSFNTSITQNTRHQFLFSKYNSLINNTISSQATFNFSTCNE